MDEDAKKTVGGLSKVGKAIVAGIGFVGTVVGIVAGWTEIASYYENKEAAEKNNVSTVTSIAETSDVYSENSDEGGRGKGLKFDSSKLADIFTDPVEEKTDESGTLEFEPVFNIQDLESKRLSQFIITINGTIFGYDQSSRQLFCDKGYLLNLPDQQYTTVDLIYDKYKDILYLVYGHDVYQTKDEEQFYEVRTRKIVLYSSLIASTSNVIASVLTKRYDLLDVGGILVTIGRLITDVRFICKVKVILASY